MAFEFDAGFVHSDVNCRRLSFADRNDDSGKHYFIIDRAEASPDTPAPDMGNVYIERDDQCWGGFGGIEQVILDRESLTIQLGPRMDCQMGGHDTIRVRFAVSDAEFSDLRKILCLIMRGYESKLEMHC